MDTATLAIQVNSTSDSSVNNGSLKSPATETDRFAFERAQFGRPDFTVQRFIYLAGKRSNLEQIHADLRAYLRELQNSMVGLINDDYADFVNLSSKLAALKDSIDKVSSDINSSWDTFNSSTGAIQKTSEALRKKSDELKSSRTKQIAIRNKIALLDSLEALAYCLSNRPSDTSRRWYTKLVHALTAVEFWYQRIPELEIAPNVAIAKERCFSKSQVLVSDDLKTDLHEGCQFIGLIISALHIIGQLEHGTKITTDLIRHSIESNEETEISRLNSLYDQVFKLRKRWISNCQVNGQFTKEVEQFLDGALLRFILEHLDSNIGELCMFIMLTPFATIERFTGVPSETGIFFESYNSTVRFARNFPHVQNHPEFLKGLNDRFNVHLYVKRVSSQLNEEILARTANTRIVYRENLKNDEHPLEASAVILRSIENMFSPKVFLPIIADRFWEVVIRLLNKHSEWIDYCLSAEPTRVVDELSGSVTVLDRWPELTALFSGSKTFDSQFFDFCLKTAFKKFEQIGTDLQQSNNADGALVDPMLFRQFLSEYSSKMEVKRNKIREEILKQLLGLAVKKIHAGVGEIPKRYRWTKQPSPTEPSSYIAGALEVQSKFGETATRQSWRPEDIMQASEELINGMVDCFLTNARQVLSTVQKTGSSLQRFKRKGATAEEQAPNGTFGESDEAKISKQFYLDTKQMRIHTESAKGKLEALDAFLNQLEQQA